MKVYLLNPPYMPHFGRGMRWQDTGRGGTLYYPIWLAYATAIVEEKYKTRLVDAPAWNWEKKDVVTDVKKFKPDLIVMDSSFPSLNNDIAVGEELKKEYPNSINVLVGPPTSQFPETILKSKGIDIVARWEYDFTLKELAQVIEKGKSLNGVAGISYKKNGKIIHNPDREFSSSEDLDAIPFVSKVYKEHLDIKDYFLGSSLYPEVQIFTGRGCPAMCTFCSWTQTLTGRKYRFRSIENVIEELRWIQDNLPEVKEVFFEDDTFTIDKKRVASFADEYKKEGLDIVWACNARANLDYDTMKKMKDANCRLLIVGYESGSDEMLKRMKKGITVKQILEFSKNARKAGLLVHGDFVIGLPGETKETIEKTKNIINETKPDILQVSVASPFPGTEFYEWCRKGGYLLTEDPNEYLDEEGHQKAIISYPALSNEEMTKEVDNILKSYYLSLNYVPIALRQIFRKKGLDELRRILFSAKMFMKYILNR
jgi:radical SAM superfamily enzyme YgiQ (UPF0313 family)